MNHVTIQNLDDKILLRLKEIAWHSGQPFEEFLRQVLADAAAPQTSGELRKLGRLTLASAQLEPDPGTDGYVASHALPPKNRKRAKTGPLSFH